MSLRLTLVATLALAAACAEDSSFVLRWQVGRTTDDANQPLLTVRQCSDMGLAYVRVITSDALGSEVDRREFSCFHPNFAESAGAAPGPEVGPGTYGIVLLGLDRRGQWHGGDPTSIDGTTEELVRATATVTVNAKGEGQLVEGFKLFGVDECHDGIDNDRDGAIDDADPPCRLGLGREDLDLSGALFRLQAQLLSGNPSATCGGLGLVGFRVVLDDNQATAQTIPCTTFAQSFSANLGPGEHTWAIEGIGPGGTAITETLGGPDTVFTVADNGFVLVPIDVDFSLDVFLTEPPFSGPLSFVIGYQPHSGALLIRNCEPDIGRLSLGSTRVAVLDGDDNILEDVVLRDDISLPTVLECSVFERDRTLDNLIWDTTPPGRPRYRLLVEAWADEDNPDTDQPCFSNIEDPKELAPGTSAAIYVPRRRSDGTCADCTTDQDCCIGSECVACIAGICQE